MKFALVVLALCVVASQAVNHDSEWAKYKLKHGKTYLNVAEETKRFNIWKNHLAIVHKHNEEFKMGKHSFTMAMNKYADMTNQEFVAMFNGFNYTLKLNSQTKPSAVFQVDPTVSVPDSIGKNSISLINRD